MESSRRLAAVIIILLIICSSMLSCEGPEESDSSETFDSTTCTGPTETSIGKRGRGDEDEKFAAAVLDLVYDRVRDVGNVFRAVGDTVGGLAVGSIKAVGAGVHGVSSVLDAVSRTAEPKSAVLVEEPSPPSASSDNLSEAADRAETRDDYKKGPKSNSPTTHDRGQDASRSSRGSSSSSDPFDRISSMARSSLVDSLKLVKAATRGVTAVLILLVAVICRGRRRHRRNGPSQQQQLYLQSAEMVPPTIPQRSHAVVGQEPPSARAAATLPGFASSCRSSSAHPPPPMVVGQLPSFGTYDGAPDGLDHLLPSPAQALGRVPHAWAGRTRTAVRGGLATGLVHEEIDVEGAAATTSGRVASEEEATRGRWDWRRVFRWTGLRRPRGEGIVQWRWILLLLLWFSASVLEERELDRVAWLAWDEGFRAGEASRVGNPDAPAESVAWLNSLVDGMWGMQRSGLRPRTGGVGVTRGTAASPGVLDGLGSFVAQHVKTSITKALDKLNSQPGRFLRIQLQEVDLGSSSPQILGVKVLDPASPAVPGWGDGRCGTTEGDCLAFRVDLEVATRGLRVCVGVKPSVYGEKVTLPTGKVRLLELSFKGSLSVRVERRDEFPFVGMALVVFDGVPDVQIRTGQWSLGTLTLGGLDKWVGQGVQVALKPFILPLYLEVDAALALCSDCPASTPANASLRQEALDGVAEAAPNTPTVGPSTHPSAAPANELQRQVRTNERQAAAEVDENKHKWRWGIRTVMRRFKDPKRSGGSLGRDSSSGENDRSEDSTDERQAPVLMASEASAADPKRSGGSLGRDSSSGENDRSETDERQAPVSMASEASSADPKRSGGSLGRDSSLGENDLSDDGTDERQAPVSMASAAAEYPKIHKRRWGIGRGLRRFKDWLMSGLDGEEDAEVDGAWRLSPADLDGFE